ncbi:MAG: DUF3515 domain-containing protein [Nocardioides sp.]
MPGRPHLSRSLLGPLLALTLLAACSAGPVEVITPDLDDAGREACEAFAADLPTSIFDLPARDVEPAGALGGAYGDPPIIVRCGVRVPEDFDQATSSCEIANGVGWYVAPEEFDDQESDVTLTTAGYRPAVAVTMSGEYRPDGPAAAIAQLAAAVDEHLTLVENCN